VKYAWIRLQARNHRVRTLCRVLGVSTSGYYAWRSRGPSARAQANERLTADITCVHQECREAYGSERTWHELRQRGVRCGRHRVARLRRLNGVVTKRRRRWLSTKERVLVAPPAPNKLSWPFHSCAPNRIWGADITQIPTREAWLYLAIVLDLHSRRVVGWAMSERQQQTLVSSALVMALTQRTPAHGLIHHSDRGVQYTSISFREELEQAGIECSMSRRGMPYDNAMVESFFSTLKNELTHHQQFLTLDQARAAVFDYIESFYNRRRRHQALGYCSPVEFEAKAAVT